MHLKKSIGLPKNLPKNLLTIPSAGYAWFRDHHFNSTVCPLAVLSGCDTSYSRLGYEHRWRSWCELVPPQVFLLEEQILTKLSWNSWSSQSGCNCCRLDYLELTPGLIQGLFQKRFVNSVWLKNLVKIWKNLVCF